ncbi:helix-turn-helix domain-containing protein [Providencia manganoxydans]|uniref:Helix-turn-helix transcriptional regulator n=1 Tax=Providencia manganoxydans TaxID=2923283 RepID=A0ABX7AFD7_9GAMM|nr:MULTISPECIES: helix-turn-helix transcriptional regulator [Providencia]MDV5227664.1 helix-turn-helix transcriptional regulator [Providencia rettgeri]MDX4947378.1 helix-turn-helix transcriptional regulator [Providencia manganoxydans]QQO62551.1 helix-turn-helix transcriptional regulator [Providencia manganoxydans]
MIEHESKKSDSQSLRKDIGIFIRESRISKSLTGTQLGNLLDVSQQQISRYENGITSINIETLDTILQILDIEWSEFYRKVLMVDVTNQIGKNKDSFPFYLHI